MLDPRLATQSRARPMTDAEAALAQALEGIFAAGTHDFYAVAVALNAQGIARPSGASDAWTGAIVLDELKIINTSLDAHYARDGLGV